MYMHTHINICLYMYVFTRHLCIGIHLSNRHGNRWRLRYKASSQEPTQILAVVASARSNSQGAVQPETTKNIPQESPKFPFRSSFEGDIGPYKGLIMCYMYIGSMLGFGFSYGPLVWALTFFKGF